MTKGGILSNLIRFSVPLMATSLLQLFYNAADVAVVGRFAGAQALAAVGSTGSLVTLMTYLFVGLSLGSNVVIAHAKGAGDEDKFSASQATGRAGKRTYHRRNCKADGADTGRNCTCYRGRM